MAQHFLLSARARTLSIGKVQRMTETQVESAFAAIRWADTNGKPVCVHCGCPTVYEARRPNGALRFRCKACRKDFSLTSGTLFAFHKMPLRTYLAAIVIFCNEVKGKSALALCRDLDCQYKTTCSITSSGSTTRADATRPSGISALWNSSGTKRQLKLRVHGTGSSSIFAEVATKRVDQLGALTHQQIPRAKHCRQRLLCLALDCDEPHRRALCDLADRFRVARVVLLPFDERLDVGGCDQPHLMAEPLKLALAKYDGSGRIRPMCLKHTLGQVQADRCNFRHGRLLRWLTPPSLWHDDAVGGRPPHHWKTITFVAAVRLCGLTAPMALDGPMNGQAFLAYASRCSSPPCDRARSS